MGCGHSDLSPPREGAPTKKSRRPHEKTTPAQATNVEKVGNPLAGQTAKATVVDETQNMIGKQKYIVEVGAIAMEDRRNGAACGTLLLFAPSDYSGIVLSYRDSRSGCVYAREFTDANLVKERDAAGITQGWAAFFKSLASDVMKTKATITATAQKVDVGITVVSSKDPKVSQPFTVRLDLKGKAGVQAAPKEVYRYMIEPMTRMVQRRRENVADKEKELRFAKAECERIVREALIAKHKSQVERLDPVVRPLRETAAAASKQSAEMQNRVSAVERKMKRMRQAKDGTTLPLDSIYEEGGARHFQHLPSADEHVPREPDLNQELYDVIRAALPTIAAEDFANSIVRAPSLPQFARLYERGSSRVVEETFRTFAKLDRWDYNVFDVERVTGNNALFTTAYAILYKLDLINYFNLDDKIVRNFLGALQSGYHPNPYHNATHAADVTQVNYFIVHCGGLRDVCQLSKEDLFAAVLAGAIHDYDHPGFNNNFHTRTNAYLSTLYNDRSILENHHCACVFEMTRLPKYNIFGNLTPEQRLEVRDIIIEMVLATDMGNHAKIFSAFRRRLTEGAEWHARRDDIRLALSMSIKMADISNCGRPNSLYVEWAKNIALEFYNQGDVEAKLKLTISPFMDRRKDKSDFPKGQTSFMNYIVMPMLEALAEFLPKMEFGVQHCHENKDYWQKVSDS